jgi:hypothetical protein
MTQTLPHKSPKASNDQQKNSGVASRFFWATVFILALATLGLTAVGSIRSTEPSPSLVAEISPTTLERLLSDTAIAAKTVTEPNISSLLDTVYGPAYDAIPAYADFHYSILISTTPF